MKGIDPEKLVRLGEVLSLLEADKFMGKRSAADFCDVGIRTLESWPIPRYRPAGGKVLYRRSELISFLETHRELPIQEKADLGRLADEVVRSVIQ